MNGEFNWGRRAPRSGTPENQPADFIANCESRPRRRAGESAASQLPHLGVGKVKLTDLSIKYESCRALASAGAL